MAEGSAFAGSAPMARAFRDPEANSGTAPQPSALVAGVGGRNSVRRKARGLTVTCESSLISSRKFGVRVFAPLSAHCEHEVGRTQSNEQILSPSTRRFGYDH